MEDEINLDNAILFADSSRGVYIPQHFAESVSRELVTGVTEEDYNILMEGPYGDLYWDVWDTVERNATVTDSDGIEYYLYQDGDLWLVPK